MRELVYLFLMMCLCSCSGESEQHHAGGEHDSFINLKALVSADIQRLESQNCGSVKRGMIDGDSASSVVSNVEWKKELQVIADADINKRAWIPHFKSDTIRHQSDTLQIIVRANRDDIPTRTINLWLVNEKIIEVYIEKRTSNLLFSSEQKITYQPGRSYHIRGTQKAVFLSRKEFEITSVFNCKE